MLIRTQTFTVNKRFPLTISRGTTAQTTNVLVIVEADGIEGWGEASPFSIGGKPQTTENIITSLQEIAPLLKYYSPLDRQKIEQILIDTETKNNLLIPSAAKAALDTALHDWLGKKLQMPLWKIWGLDTSRIVPTSVTIGINSPAGARERVRKWLEFTEVKLLKVKLGNPDGIDADREMLLAVQDEAPHIPLMVDANCAWNLDYAIKMSHWLAQLGIKYIEQPLPVGDEEKLKLLRLKSPLPIFVDESCFNSSDIPRLAELVDGINIKLMKAGGLTEVLKMIHTARACNLQVMFGCYSDSCLANTAMSQLAPLADYLDLDSHLNLIDDPFTGATMKKGCLIPNNLSGLGVQKRASNT